MRTRTKAAVGLLSAIGLVFSSTVAAHPAAQSDGGETGQHGGGADGHVPVNTNYGFTAVGHSALSGVQNGRYTDVWVHADHAYVGSFQDPDCSRAGVYIADLTTPTSPQYVNQIKSPPNTRVNDVKVTDVGDRDVLIFSLEKCGDFVGTNSKQKGQGGIALWDVTDPTNPHALKQNFLDFQVHNTYPWTTEDGTFALVVDDENLDDVHVVDLTKPQAPKHIATTGIGTWIEQGYFDVATSELFLGSFATPLLHDVWVEWNETKGIWEAVLSYWDAGFITLDVSDPHNPKFIDDSDYLAQDPVLSEFRSEPEGNAHAAVFGGDENEFIFGGDEDFDVLSTVVTVDGVNYAATTGSGTPALTVAGVTGTPVSVGVACGGIAPAGDPLDIALIERGGCAFTDKATNVEAAGYAAGVVFNSDAAGNCEASVSMLVEGDIPMVFVPRSSGFAILGAAYDPTLCGAGTGDAAPAIGTAGPIDATVSAAFDGWGYFWVINNTGAPMENVNAMGNSRMMDGVNDVTVEAMGTVGYYAPAEVSDPALASGAGDLTMHNLETDVVDGGRNRSFISWYALGMRAVEWRNGHYHDSKAPGQSVDSWNVHEVGRWIAPFQEDPLATDEDKATMRDFASAAGVQPNDLAGSNFWGVTQYVQDDTRYVVASDRNTGLWVFEWDCVPPANEEQTLYCQLPMP